VTLALAICCRDGIVFAADSQSTLLTSGQTTKQDAEKLYVLGDRIAWAGSGALGAIQRVELALRSHVWEIVRAFSQSHEHGAQAVFDRVNVVQKAVAAEVVGEPGAGGSAYLFGGYGTAGQFLLEISADGVRQWGEKNHFTAIGSGDIFAVHAYRSISHYSLASLSLVLAQALAYRTVANAIATAAFGLGGAVRLSVVTPAGASIVPEGDLEAVRDLVALWEQREVELLADLDAPPASPANDPTDPPRE
jgi:20S proteasome alpha/beta subunit